jgi:hypothetical protein
LSFVASCAPKFVATTESKWRLPLSESTADAVAAAARNIFRLGAKSSRASEELPAVRDANASIIYCGRFAFEEEAVRKGSEETQETRSSDVYVYAFRVGCLLVALPDETGASHGQTVGSKSSAVAAACVGGRVAGDAKRLARLMAFAKTVDDAKGDRLAFAGAARLDQSTNEAEGFH